MQNVLQNSPTDAQLTSFKNLTFLTYILYFIGTVSLGTFSTIGLILAYVRRTGTYGTIYYSHLSRLIHTYWIFIGIQIIGFILIYAKGIGFIVLGIGYIWYLYRLISGFTKLSDSQPI